MKSSSNRRRWLAVLTFVAMAIPLGAPLAEAGHAKWRRHRAHFRETRVVRQVVRPTYRGAPHGSYTVWRSSAGPVVAGFVGGLFLGATIASAAPVGYAYWDPYCHRGFPSLDVYYTHCRAHRHARVVHVIEIPIGYHWDDYHYCGYCDGDYWGDVHDCD